MAKASGAQSASFFWRCNQASPAFDRAIPKAPLTFDQKGCFVAVVVVCVCSALAPSVESTSLGWKGSSRELVVLPGKGQGALRSRGWASLQATRALGMPSTFTGWIRTRGDAIPWIFRWAALGRGASGSHAWGAGAGVHNSFK